MFDWLFEGRQSVYLVLAALAVIAAGLWARSGFVLVREQHDPAKKPKHRIAWPILVLGVLLVLGLGYFLLDRLVETPREQITRKLDEMAAAVKKRDVDGIFKHISERFHVQGQDKKTFRGWVEGKINSGRVEELVLWEYKFTDVPGQVSFTAKAKGNFQDVGGWPVRAQFVLDDDGQWRLKEFGLYPPMGDSTTPITITNLN